MPSPSGAQAAQERTTPLAGIRVVDLSTALPGAYCTQFLADCGADVLMVEAPGGSPVRSLRGWPASGAASAAELSISGPAPQRPNWTRCCATPTSR